MTEDDWQKFPHHTTDQPAHCETFRRFLTTCRIYHHATSSTTSLLWGDDTTTDWKHYWQEKFTLHTHLSTLTVYYELGGRLDCSLYLKFDGNALWFFLKPISTTDWYINNTDWPDIKKKYWHWTSYVSKATGLFDATPLYHPWSANAWFASSCLQKPLDNKCPGSPRREDTTFTTIHILGMWHLWTIYGSRSKHRRKALRSLDFHFLLYIHVQVTHLPHPFSLTISISLLCRYLLPQKRP